MKSGKLVVAVLGMTTVVGVASAALNPFLLTSISSPVSAIASAPVGVDGQDAVSVPDGIATPDFVPPTRSPFVPPPRTPF